MQSTKRSGYNIAPSESTNTSPEPVGARKVNLERKVDIFHIEELEEFSQAPSTVTVRHNGTLIKFSCLNPVAAACAIFRNLEGEKR